MKNKIYLFSTVIIAFLLFTNNAAGPVSKQQKGYTGAPGDSQGTCANCHNTGTFSSSATLQVFDSLGTTPVSRYIPGRQYTIRMTINASSGTPTAYGFQMIDIRSSDSSNIKGFLPKAQQSADIGIDTITASNRVYAGQNARLTSNIINVKWKAPATDIGGVRFYAAGNAVNGNGTFAGDNGTPSVVAYLNSATSSTNELATKVDIKISPNPTPSQVLITVDSKISKTLDLRISDLSGRSVISQKWAVNVGLNTKNVDLNNLAKGAYMLQLFDNQNVVSKQVIKI